ncbi:unnamed protein product, partial [Gulo gulo]
MFFWVSYFCRPFFGSLSDLRLYSGALGLPGVQATITSNFFKNLIFFFKDLFIYLFKHKQGSSRERGRSRLPTE